MSRLTGEIGLWIRLRSCRKVLARLRSERIIVRIEIAEQRGWDGVPAPLIARDQALTEAIDAIETVYH